MPRTCPPGSAVPGKNKLTQRSCAAASGPPSSFVEMTEREPRRQLRLDGYTSRLTLARTRTEVPRVALGFGLCVPRVRA
jgi:hypothetical protein